MYDLKNMLSGRIEKLPYSLSRWTDLPTAKWSWFEAQLDQGWMLGIDPRTAFPSKWSLAPADVLGLIFWTRNPANLIANAKRLEAYPLVVHMTLTGWHEVEKGAPTLEEGIGLLRGLVGAFGASRVTWRFSPVPLVKDVVGRFEALSVVAAELGLTEVFVSFLQENDLMPETRAPRMRQEVLRQLASRSHGLKVLLCNEDRALDLNSRGPTNLSRGICESGRRFVSSTYEVDHPSTEGCGCALAVDPFTINESCSMGCRYCYAADKTLATKKRNTTKSLPVVR